MSIGRRVRVLLAVVGLSLATALPVLAAQGPTKLEAASVSPDGGSTTTTITFQVTYRSVKDLPPDFVRVTVAGATHAMTGAGSDWKGGVRFTWRGTLPMGTHDVVFKARDAEKFVDELNAGPVVIGGVAPTPRPTPDPSSGPDPSTGPDPSDPAPSDDPGASTDPGASGDPTASADPSASNDPSASTDPSPSGDPAAGGAGSVPEPDERDGWWLPADGGSGGGSGSGTGSGSGSGTGSGTTTGPGGSESAVEPEDDGGIAAAVGRWFGSLADAAGGTVDAFLGVLVAGVPGPGASALGGGGRGSLPTVPSMVLTTTGVGVWMAFMLFGKRRRDEEPPAPDAALQLAAAAGSGRAGTAVLATAPVPMLDPEALMPRWRRPSLLEARKTDPVRAPAAARPRQSFDTAFGDIDATMERRLVRYAVVQLLDRPDEVYAERIGEVEAGDEIAVVAQSGVYRQVRCPDGREGWLHRMTLGDVVVPVRDHGYDEDAQGPSIDAAGAMAALLAARGLR